MHKKQYLNTSKISVCSNAYQIKRLANQRSESILGLPLLERRQLQAFIASSIIIHFLDHRKSPAANWTNSHARTQSSIKCSTAEIDSFGVVAEHWEAALATVLLENSADDGGDRVVGVDEQSNRAGTADNVDGDENLVAFATSLSHWKKRIRVRKLGIRVWYWEETLQIYIEIGFGV